MNAAEFKARALEHLERLEEAEAVASMSDQQSIDWLMEIHDRFQHARLAFPGMTWEEFNKVAQGRVRRRGRPQVGKLQRSGKPIVRAARDVKRIRDFWRRESGTSRGIPADPIEIAAGLHGVDEVELGELIRRPLSRR